MVNLNEELKSKLIVIILLKRKEKNQIIIGKMQDNWVRMIGNKNVRKGNIERINKDEKKWEGIDESMRKIKKIKQVE